MNHYSLLQLGWQPFFQQQLTLEELESLTPYRVFEQHRSQLILLGEQGEKALPVTKNLPQLTVGDWVLLNANDRFERALERLSLISRKASGTQVKEQLIASNIDTLFILCSLNQDFNLNRIERYLALAHETQIEPVVVLSKADLCDDPQSFKEQVLQINPMLWVETVNCLDEKWVEALRPFCSKGKTVAMVGSSGTGKSTLTNFLMKQNVQSTGGIREDDSKGRHTTTSRSLHLTSTGGLIMDTPGMREIQLAFCEEGVSETFSDIEKIAQECKFSDCHHESEPGCAVRKAIEDGQLDERRFVNFSKLLREQAKNSASLSEKRAKEKALSKMYHSVQSQNRRFKEGR